MSNEGLPKKEWIKNELVKERNKRRFRKILKNTVYTLLVVAAVAVLIATFVLPVIQISGTSMEPTLSNGEIVVLFKTDQPERGDLCGFSYSNMILIKRVIGLPGDTIHINEQGEVFVNGQALNEPYIDQLSYGECDIEFPFTVPENEYFLLGDQRETSIDSRSSVIGTVEKSQMVGVLFLRIWPLKQIDFMK